jgi:hypothetical protein
MYERLGPSIDCSNLFSIFLPIIKGGMVPFYFFREVGHLLARTLTIFISRNKINLLVMCTRPSRLLGLNLILKTT